MTISASTPLANDCFDCCAQHGALMSVDDALAAMRDRVTPVAAIERVPLRQALGRILAEEPVSTINVPAFDNSAVDGWAVFLADLSPDRETRLPVGGRIAAGHPLVGQAVAGHAYRIFTGAPVPAGPDVVLMQEDCREEDGFVTLPAWTKPHANIRNAGEAVAVGDRPLRAGTRLLPQHIGVAATIGQTELAVRAPLKVAIFSTGDEVRNPGQPLDPGCLWDSNRYTMHALLTRAGCVVTDLGILPDKIEAVTAALAEAAPHHDLIVTSGGVSVGEEDHVKGAVQSLGSLHLWRLALKPGKPLALGQIKGTPFLGLPGNPVAVMVTFLLFGRALLAQLSGANWSPLRGYPLPAGFTLKKKPGRREFPRAKLEYGPTGPVVTLFRSDSSGVLTSMTACDGLVDLPQNGLDVAPGDLVSFIPFAEVLP